MIIMNNRYKSIIEEIDKIHNIRKKLNNRENNLYEKIKQLNI